MAEIEPTIAATGIFDLVIADLHERDRIGWAQHNRPLQAHDGRDTLRDAYEEALDLAVYLRKAIEERELNLPKERSVRGLASTPATVGLELGPSDVDRDSSL